MAMDIDTAVRNHDEMQMKLRGVEQHIADVGKERAAFIMAQDKIRGQIKDFENFLNEFRGI